MADWFLYLGCRPVIIDEASTGVCDSVDGAWNRKQKTMIDTTFLSLFSAYFLLEQKIYLAVMENFACR